MARARSTGPRGGSGPRKAGGGPKNSKGGSSQRGDSGRGRKRAGDRENPWASATTRTGKKAATPSRAASGVKRGSNRPSRPPERIEQPPAPPRQTAPEPDGSRETPTSAQSAEPVVSVKLQKLLADAGLGSRRQLERWIESGRVEVDGVKATLGERVTGTERIVVDGKPLDARARAGTGWPRVVLINKSEGVICTRRDPEGRKTVFADLPTLKNGRWISIGRLDVATTGLLLLCNDGELAHRMMHPSTGLDREYAVRTDVVLEDEQLEALKAGVDSDGELLRFADIRYFDGRGSNHWYHVVLLEGRNHEVRRLFASVGAEVRRLKRVRYGPVLLPSWLRRGQRFELNNADVSALYKVLGMRADLPPERPNRKSDRRALADRSVLIPYPELPGVVAAPGLEADAPNARAARPSRDVKRDPEKDTRRDSKKAAKSDTKKAAKREKGKDKAKNRPQGESKAKDNRKDKVKDKAQAKGKGKNKGKASPWADAKSSRRS